jgi:hypothetical protein
MSPPWSPTGETTPRIRSLMRFVEVWVAGAQFVDQADDEVDGLDLVERAVALLAARGTDRLVDEGFFGHV